MLCVLFKTRDEDGEDDVDDAKKLRKMAKFSEADGLWTIEEQGDSVRNGTIGHWTEHVF